MNTRHTAILILALRNLRRYLRRTTLAATAMIIGGMLLMFSLSLGDGTHEEWIESGVRMGTGHVTVEAPAFRASPTIDNRLSASARAAAEQALLVPGVAGRCHRGVGQARCQRPGELGVRRASRPDHGC